MNARTIGGDSLLVGGIAWHVADGCADYLRRWFPAHFLAALDDSACVLKADKGSRVSVAGGLAIKESTARRGRSMWRFGLRRSGSRRAFILGLQLRECGIRTPRPMAWATVRYFGLRAKDYLITEQLRDHAPLTEKLSAAKDDPPLRRQIVTLLGELLASFHSNGFSNRDMKADNILVLEDKAMSLSVVDLDGVRRMRVGRRRRAHRDFWPIVRSFRQHDWPSEFYENDLSAAYNACAPARLRITELPRHGVGAETPPVDAGADHSAPPS